MKKVFILALILGLAMPLTAQVDTTGLTPQRLPLQKQFEPFKPDTTKIILKEIERLPSAGLLQKRAPLGETFYMPKKEAMDFDSRDFENFQKSLKNIKQNMKQQMIKRAAPYNEPQVPALSQASLRRAADELIAAAKTARETAAALEAAQGETAIAKAKEENELAEHKARKLGAKYAVAKKDILAKMQERNIKVLPEEITRIFAEVDEKSGHYLHTKV